MKLSGDEGTEFYVFRDINDEKEFKKQYHEKHKTLYLHHRIASSHF
jgi:heme oxygenase